MRFRDIPPHLGRIVTEDQGETESSRRDVDSVAGDMGRF